jgi:DegV family protein with EDD domain
MTGIAIVTDSTANLPQTTVDYYDITVVPVQVIVSGRGFDEGVSISAQQVADEMRSAVPVTTSRPAPARFLEVYQSLAERGFTEIVSIHLSAELSGTYDAAVIAAEQSPIGVTVLDSRTISMGLGYAVIAGARSAKRGRTVQEVAAEVKSTATRTRVLFYVDSLEYLRRGGRIGSAERIIGQALAVKPILHVAKGRVQPLEKVRTMSKALGRLEDLTVETAGSTPANIAVMHLDARKRAEDLAERVRRRLPDADILIGEVGAVIGSHVGPGMVASVISPVPPP